MTGGIMTVLHPDAGKHMGSNLNDSDVLIIGAGIAGMFNLTSILS